MGKSLQDQMTKLANNIIHIMQTFILHLVVRSLKNVSVLQETVSGSFISVSSGRPGWCFILRGFPQILTSKSL